MQSNTQTPETALFYFFQLRMMKLLTVVLSFINSEMRIKAYRSFSERLHIKAFCKLTTGYKVPLSFAIRECQYKATYVTHLNKLHIHRVFWHGVFSRDEIIAEKPDDLKNKPV